MKNIKAKSFIQFQCCMYFVVTLYTWSRVRHRLASGRIVQKEILPSGDVSRINISCRERLWRMEFCNYREETKILIACYSKWHLITFICFIIYKLYFFSVKNHLPSWFGHLSEVREVVFDPHVNLFQCHSPALPTVNGKLDHGHVGVRWALWHGLLSRLCIN